MRVKSVEVCKRTFIFQAVEINFECNFGCIKKGEAMPGKMYVGEINFKVSFYREKLNL